MTRVAVVGLGYVGLPLAVAFGRVMDTVGIDLSAEKVESYRNGEDPTGEMPSETLRAASKLTFSTTFDPIADADFVIVAVPTPIDSARRPDFAPLLAASHSVGDHMQKGVTVVYESTVYPGATEEVCLPVLEERSSFKWRDDFHLGYSPERINPGDTEHSLEKIVKVVAGDDDDTLERVAGLYAQIIEAGVYRAPSIRVAEAAKVIENTQRDLNIALMNELAIIFDRAGLDTMDILETAKTKWNFLPFRPGLVGGHCIGVDPYYLTYKAEALDYHPQVILAGRRINDGMSVFVAEQTVKCLVRAGSAIHGATVNVLGVTFKENVADVRNSKVFDLVRELESYKIDVNVHDPLVSELPSDGEGGRITLRAWEDLPQADATIVAVAHKDFLERPLEEIAGMIKPGGCFIDVQSRFDRTALEQKGLNVWRL